MSDDWKVEHELWQSLEGQAQYVLDEAERAMVHYERLHFEAEAHRERMELLMGATVMADVVEAYLTTRPLVSMPVELPE